MRTRGRGLEQGIPRPCVRRSLWGPSVSWSWLSLGGKPTLVPCLQQQDFKLGRNASQGFQRLCTSSAGLPGTPRGETHIPKQLFIRLYQILFLILGDIRIEEYMPRLFRSGVFQPPRNILN